MSEDSIATLFQLLREQTKELAALSLKVGRMDERMQLREKVEEDAEKCGKPGYCLKLEPRIAALEAARVVDALAQAEARGVKKGVTLSARAVWGLVATLGVSGILSVLKLIEIVSAK